MWNHGGYHNVRQIFPLSGPQGSLTLKFTSSSIRLAGNGVTGLPFTNNTSAAFIGVVGSLILSPPLCLLYLRIPTSPGEFRSECLSNPLLTVFVFPPYSAVIGVIGSSVLLYSRVDLGGFNISKASVAGIFGGLVLLAPAMFGFHNFLLLISVITSSIWSAMMRGVKLVHVKLTENWMDRSYGSRGDDLEINMEFQIPPGRD